MRALQHLTDALEGDVTFRIVTRDRDFGDGVAYPNVPADAWTRLGCTDVLYLSPPQVNAKRVRALLEEEAVDLIYLNSFFSPRFSILVNAMNATLGARQRPVIVAPRGEFADSALAYKPVRKRVYLAAARVSGLYRRATWHASSELEASDIRNKWGAHARVFVAPEIVQRTSVHSRHPKRRGEIRVVFIGRVARVKNLDGALHILSTMEVPVSYDVYGQLEDPAYEAECRALISGLPEHVKVTLHGPTPPTELATILAKSDVLLLPSRGENFGHAIIEAMAAGCPVLISDQTPWRNLEREGAGWDVPLTNEPAFRAALTRVAGMDETEWLALSRSTAGFAARFVDSHQVRASNRELFLSVARGGSSR